MRSTSTHPPVAAPAKALAAALQKALAMLLEAHACSRELRKSAWEFAVEVPALLEAGCTRNALRWLEAQGYVEHAIETTRPKGKARVFRPVRNLSLAARTCFVLTKSGVALARQGWQPQQMPEHLQGNGVVLFDAKAAALLPHWDAGLRELRLGDCLIKRFRVPAPNQEWILGAFEEEGWPSHLDDPLPPNGHDGKRRLHDTIDRLNRNQKQRLIHFGGDGTGRGVYWELLGK